MNEATKFSAALANLTYPLIREIRVFTPTHANRRFADIVEMIDGRPVVATRWRWDTAEQTFVLCGQFGYPDDAVLDEEDIEPARIWPIPDPPKPRLKGAKDERG